MNAGAVGLAWLLDRTRGEPSLSVHPVRLAGRWLDWVSPAVPSAPAAKATLAGGVAWTVGAGAALLAGVTVERAVASAPTWARSAALGVALWPLFSQRLLIDEVEAVERALHADVASGRQAVSRLVSRDVGQLSESGVRQAAIESLGENLSDSVVAPLLWFAVGGLPAAALYRYANTADAMWGHRSPRWQHAGTVPARVDDLLNLVPARLTGLALAAPTISVRDVRREARCTPSPNAGWPMAALALRLGVRLEKVGTYTLVIGGRPASAADTDQAVRLARIRGLMFAAAAALAGGRGARRRRRNR